MDWLLLGIGFAAGTVVSLRPRDLPLAAIALGTGLVVAALRMGGFW
jgi:hypothetical protein